MGQEGLNGWGVGGQGKGGSMEGTADTKDV